MKYKVGDRVRIKDNIERYNGDISSVEFYLKKNNYILTIYAINEKKGYYIMQGWQGIWEESSIIGLYEEIIYEPINNRFEILDL